MTDRPIDKVLARLGNRVGTQRGDTWQCRCPAHEDNRASLCVTVGDDGRALLKCHAGCATEDIIDHLGMKMVDLFPSNGNGEATKSEIIATYDYRDATGALVYQAVRKLPKGFFQRRPKPGGGWVYKKVFDGVQRVLYRLPDLLKADPSVTVFIPEGEKDVDHLHHNGAVATTNVGGAGKWRKEYNEHLHGRHVVILPDNDNPGLEHGVTVARSLQGTATSIKIVELPGLLEHGDVSDWLGAGHTIDELKELAVHAPEWSPAEPELPRATFKTVDEPQEHRRLTDMGNAERLIDQHGQNIRYCWPWQKWLIWDGQRWQIDDGGGIDDLAQRTVRTIYQEASEEDDFEERSRIARWAVASEKRDRVSAMIAMARSKVPAKPDELNQNPWLLNVENGTMDLRTGEIRGHDRDDFITQIAPVVFDPAADCPLWLRFLQEVFAGNGSVMQYAQQLVGYSATGIVRDHILPISGVRPGLRFTGGGRSGRLRPWLVRYVLNLRTRFIT